MLDENGAPALWVGDSEGAVARTTTGTPLEAFAWYFVRGSYDPTAGTISISQEPKRGWPRDHSAATAEAHVTVRLAGTQAPLLIAAYWNGHEACGHFNGKIEAPRVLGHEGSTIAAWDFALDIPSVTVTDSSPNELHGVSINNPMRATTGHDWSGRETDWRRAPEEYAAIFFHSDDLEDAGWEPDFKLVVPHDLRTGVYAARLSANDSEDYVPFFVRPPRGTATAPIALLIPTYSYMAYANEHITWLHPRMHGIPLGERLQPQDEYAARNRLMSLYDHHEDGTGCCFSSRLRPIVNMRPKYNLALIDGPHQLNADLHLVDWLEAKGHQYDVITDEDLHTEGESLLNLYRVLLFGTHPEYPTASMLEAIEGYTLGGGRLVYLGGNGFYWVTAVDPNRPHIIEVRRGARGTGSWRSAPGEWHHATTGEPGGLWRDRGFAPQRMVGVGFTAMGFAPARPFRREPGSFDPRAEFVFKGVGDDEEIGGFGLVMGGAAGHEIDRVDYSLGTPPHALTLATATGFPDEYQHAVEEVEGSDSQQGGTVSPFVRGDMVFYETPGDGAVFSAGSMCWCGCLSHNMYDNNVSRITDNVLRRFVDPAPF